MFAQTSIYPQKGPGSRIFHFQERNGLLGKSFPIFLGRKLNSERLGPANEIGTGDVTTSHYSSAVVSISSVQETIVVND